MHCIRIFHIGCAVLMGSGLLANEGTKPKAGASEYSAHAESAPVAIGADYNVRTVAAGGKSVFLRDYLAVEVALYPAAKQSMTASVSSFTLRINGSKSAIYAQHAGAVGASIKYPDWERRPQLVGEAGPVIIGRDPSQPRFPGDVREMQTPDNSAALEQAEWVAEVSLREGPTRGPVSGYLYFPYRGKPEKIRSLELLYDLGPTSAPLRIRLR